VPEPLIIVNVAPTFVQTVGVSDEYTGELVLFVELETTNADPFVALAGAPVKVVVGTTRVAVTDVVWVIVAAR